MLKPHPKVISDMKRHVLIVEDDDLLAQSIARNLNARGFSTILAPTVEAAIREVETASLGLMLLDVDLPDGSGWEVLRTLRGRSTKATPVVVISGLRPNRRLVEELGCIAVLEKPFPIEAVLRVVHDRFRDQAHSKGDGATVTPVVLREEDLA